MADGATTIRTAEPADYPAIFAITDAAFGRDEEAILNDDLRADDDVVLELVTEQNGAIVAHIMFSKMASDGGDFIALGPVSVTPALQRSGFGGQLIREGIARLKAQGRGAIVLLGHVEYYPRFGFSHEATKLFQGEYDRTAFMALELVPGTLVQGGQVRFAPSFGVQTDG
jgi:putative acetyltransferase